MSGIVSIQRLGSETKLKPEDLKRLREDEYLSRLETEFRKKAESDAEAKLLEEKKNLEKLKAVVEQEKLVLESRLSELDSIPPESNFDALIQDEQEIQTYHPVNNWWKEMGLDDDPFSSDQGLQGIPESKYEDVVVQTPFVKLYLDKLTKDPQELLGKAIVLIGEYGSGKTTLMQILGHNAGGIGIFPIMVNMNPQSPRMTAQFVSQVTENVRRATHLRHDEESLQLRAADEIGYGIHVMELGQSTVAKKGYLITVDGLHKPEVYTTQSLEFLQQLQGFQERLGYAKIPCGILVAGSLSWEDELTKNPSLSGSFYKVEKLPYLAENNAAEAVIRRINSFVPPDKPFPTIAKTPLRRAYQVLAKRVLHPLTFRDYLNDVRDRFIARDYSSIGLSLTLQAETIETVKIQIRNTDLSSAYDRLVDAKKHTSAFRLALRIILPQIFINSGIIESDPLFKKNIGAFFVLRREGFIVQRVNLSGTEISWHLSKKVVEFLQSVNDNHKIPPEDTLAAMFSEVAESVPVEAETIYGHVRRQLNEMIASWKSSWPDISDLLANVDKRIEEIEKGSGELGGLMSARVLENIKVSINNLLKIVKIIARGPKYSLEEPTISFRTLWCIPENVDEWLELANRNTPLPTNLSLAFGVLHDHVQAVSDLLSLISSLIRGEGVSRLSNRQISTEQAIELHEARTLFLSQRYQESVGKLAGAVESTVRDVVFTVARCATGEDLSPLLPSDILKETTLIRGHPRTKRGPDENFLYSLSRSEYSKVIFQKNLKNILFKNLLSNQETDKMKDEMEMLFSLADRVAHQDRPSFFREHSTEISDCLKFVPRICETFNQIEASMIEGNDFLLRKTDKGSVTFIFDQKKYGYLEREIEASQVEELVIDILQLLTSGPILVPPIEERLNFVEGTIENALAVLRESVNQGLVNLYKSTDGFGYEFSITERGKERLSRIKPLFIQRPTKS